MALSRMFGPQTSPSPRRATPPLAARTYSPLYLYPFPTPPHKTILKCLFFVRGRPFQLMSCFFPPSRSHSPSSLSFSSCPSSEPSFSTEPPSSSDSSKCDSSDSFDPPFCCETLRRATGALTPLLFCCETFQRATGALTARMHII